MRWKAFFATQNDAERRFDRVLKRLLSHRTQSQIYSAIRKELAKLNGKKAEPSDTISDGDEILIAEFLLEENFQAEEISGERRNQRGEIFGGRRRNQREEISLSTEEIFSEEENFKIEILFQNEHLIFVNKPRGISVHGGGGKTPSLEKIILKNNKAENSLSFKQGPLHRLDKNTSGIVAFSKSLAGARWFTSCIKSRSVKKFYLGIAEGNLQNEETWSEEIGGKESVTIARPIERIGWAAGNDAAGGSKKSGSTLTLVQYQILTGRKHQIRIHSALHAHPLAGDTRYGSKTRPAPCRAFKTLSGFATEGARPYFLHAYKMELPKNDLRIPTVILDPRIKEFF